MKKVLFLYRFLPQYKVDFFQQLRKTLLNQNIELLLIYGKRTNKESLRKDEGDIEWSKYIPNIVFKIGNIELIWQPCLRHLKDIDFVIIQPESKLLITYYLAYTRLISNFKLGFWGHGRNMHANINGLRNRFQRLFLKKCDHWFTYTDQGKQSLARNNFPGNRITVTNNAIDTVGLMNYYSKVNDNEIIELKKNLRFRGNKTGIYCGGMYPNKRLDFIIEVCYRVKNDIPDFQMIFIGTGIDSYIVEEASNRNPWICYAGPKFDKDRIKYFKISSVQLMPRAVGLGILDSFAMETPLITTNNQFHGPEIEYLENGFNGLMTNDNIDDYTNSVIEVLKTDKYLELIKGCKLSAEIYTIESMVENFKTGILSVLKR